jgi:hypothetical protein
MSTICIRLSRTELEIHAGKGVCASPFLAFFLFEAVHGGTKTESSLCRLGMVYCMNAKRYATGLI